jgi:putative MATE family efflux protein
MNETLPLGVPGATIARQVARMAAPVLVEQTLLYLVGLSDTILTGRYLLADHLAAVTVASYLLWFLASLLTVVSVGATALVARLMGSNQRPAARRVCQQAVAMALAVGGLMLLVGWTAAPGVVGLMNLKGLAALAAVEYLRIILAVTPLLACTAVGVACLRGAGDTVTGMWVMVLVNAVNVGLSWSLVRGFGPLPELGFPGIAIGTAAAEGIGGLVVLAVLTHGRAGLRLDWSGVRPVWPEVRRILRISLPAAGESLTNILCQLWFLGLINRLGSVATAAHGVAIRCESISFLTVAAFSVPASTLTGQYLGAGRADLASRSVRTAWAMGTAVLVSFGAILYGLADPLFALFLGGGQPPGVAEAGVPVIRLVAFAMPALATINVLNGALRGAGDTRWPWLFVVIGYLGVRLPMAYALIAPWGLYGAWIAMFADLHVRAVLIAARFLHGGWRSARV